jgi:ureidoacrylate peracid hydrolase
VSDSFSDHRSSTATVAPLSGPASALLVIDLVRDFVDPGGAMPLPGAEVLLGRVNALASATRRAGGRVVWVRDEHEDLDDAEFRVRLPHCLAGTGGSELAEGLERQPGDRDQIKRRYSAFYGTDLNQWLVDRGLTHVVLCGVVTNICVRSTAHDAFFHGFDVTVVSDGCLGTGPREHDAALYDLATHFGQVRTAAEVEGLLAAGGSR